MTVIKQGFQDLVQDLGRDGYTHIGISPTGGADKVSMKIANLFLGNHINDAVLEITLFGGTYLFDMPTTICLSGSHFPATIRGEEVPLPTRRRAAPRLWPSPRYRAVLPLQRCGGGGRGWR